MSDDRSHRETNLGSIDESNLFNTDDDNHRLAAWKDRSGSNGVSDDPVGRGDLLEISLPRMAALPSTVVRVSNEGKISLAFIGMIHLPRLTEQESKHWIVQRRQILFPGLTRLGARVAAGNATFAAHVSGVRLARTGKTGEKNFS